MAYRGARACVACGGGLVSETSDGTSLERCPNCGGIWIHEAEFLTLLRATPTAQRIDELMEHNDGSPRRPCPVCARRMNLAWIDFLQIDRCPTHGVWLDAGELQVALRSRGAWDDQVRQLAKAMKKK